MNENITAYVEQEQRPFAEVPLCDADVLAFAALQYMEFERFPHFLEEGASTPIAQLGAYGTLKQYVEHDCNPKGMLPLLKALVESARFGGVHLERFECIVGDDPAIQYAASTFVVAPELVVVVFRGTDSKLVGWRESFDMVYKEAIPGQVEALRYLRETAAAYPDARIVATGHSKGGACAEYACVFADDALAARLQDVISFDGPALFKVGGTAVPDLEAYDQALLERYGQVAGRPLVRYVFPSAVGLLMERRDAAQFSYTESVDSDLTHNVCSVRIVDGQIVRRTPSAKELADATGSARILRTVSLEERQFIAAEVVEACKDAGISIELSGDGPARILKALGVRYLHSPRSNKRLFRGILSKLMKK